METFSHDLPHLFEQLGLASTSDDIGRFVTEHRLDRDCALAEATFWSAAQASFLRAAIREDADWAETVDQLDAMLRT